MIKKSHSITIVIRYDNKFNVVGKSYNNAKVRIEGNTLIFEDVRKQVELNEEQMIKIDGENVELTFRDEDNRVVYVGMLVR